MAYNRNGTVEDMNASHGRRSELQGIELSESLAAVAPIFALLSNVVLSYL
jgi:hypothetical protein